ncbi:hypothetical protein M0802_013936 [Mischocyttarus mexicanus]|nr:hypothetical protein M0802_013936 [Mischocyttarus mexicanus]
MHKKQDYSKINQESIPVTPQMIRNAVKVLQMRKLFVNSELIIDYLIKHYPVDKKTLTIEIIPKLKHAVRIGLIAKCGQDQFYIPTLLEDANTFETTFTPL